MKYGRVVRLTARVLLTVTAIANLMFAWQARGTMQSAEGALRDEGDFAILTEAKQNGPHVKFYDGKPLAIGLESLAGEPVALAAADVDTDGFADVVMADSAGSLSLLKGRGPRVVAYKAEVSPDRQRQPEPFTVVATDVAVGFAPDQLLAGDLSADGKPDLVAAVRGSNSFSVMIGTGTGAFSTPVTFGLPGPLTAIQRGEIGRSDGQTDLAVAYTTEGGSFLAVFEHPEGAFKNPPEIIRLPAAANAIAIGNLDEDAYSDIAVGCGETLVVVHERGQAYPWDILKDSGIARPPAVVDVRQMPFSVAALAVGRFGEQDRSSLALLGKDGNIYRLEPAIKPSDARRSAQLRRSKGLKEVAFKPTGAEPTAYVTTDTQLEPAVADGDQFGNPLLDPKQIADGDVQGYVRGLLDEKTTNLVVPTTTEATSAKAVGAAKRADLQEKGKSDYIRAISAKATPVSSWKMTELSSGFRFAAAAASGDVQLLRANSRTASLTIWSFRQIIRPASRYSRR